MAPSEQPRSGRVIRHIVWDFNGTLIDDVALINESTNVAFADLGLPAFSQEEYRLHYTRPIQTFYHRLLGRPMTEAEWSRVEEVWQDHYTRHEASTPLVAGVHEVLAEVSALAWTQSVCSMYPHELLQSRVEALGLAHHFVSIEGLRGAGGGTKSSLLVTHIEALGIPPDQVVMIGDSLDDATAAVDAGAYCVLLDSGIHHETVLAGVDVHVTRTLADALRHVVGTGPR